MKRRWFQFRLRTLFILLTLAAVVTGVVQHVWFVRGRIQFHEGKLVTCEERLTLKLNVNSYFFLQKLAASESQPDSGPDESVRIQQAIGEGYLLLYLPENRSEVDIMLANEHMKEVSRLEDTQNYHQRQADAYRRAMWRPWMRVAEDRNQELADERLETVTTPTPAVTTSFPSPPLMSLEASFPKLPPSPKIRLPWQSIERPLPPNFDQRDVQTQKSADA